MTASPAHGSAATWALVLLALACFGPYLPPGLRTGQLAVYACLGFALWRCLRLGPAWGCGRLPALVAGLFAAAALWCLLSSVIQGKVADAWLGQLAGLENLVQPMAIIVAACLLLRGLPAEERCRTLKRLALVLMLCLQANTIVSLVYWAVLDPTQPGQRIAPVYGQLWPLTSALRYFWSAENFQAGFSPVPQPIGHGFVPAAEETMMFGRFTGIFNMPLEAGLTYSLALLLWVHLFEGGRRAGWAWSLLPALLIGGLLSASKAFFGCGLPLAAMLAWWRLRPRRSHTLAALAVLAVLGGLGYWLRQPLYEFWPGSTHLPFYWPFYDLNRLLVMLSGNRGGTLASMGDVLSRRPWLGWGLGGNGLPYDVAPLEFIIQGGAPAGLLLAAIYATLAVTAYRAMVSDPPPGAFVTSLVLLVFLASLGGPALTINRFSPLFWLVLVLAAPRGTKEAGVGLVSRAKEV